jgi:hypothetical protein
MKGPMELMLIALVWLASAGLADAEGWQMPSLNPFKKKDSHPAHLRITDDKSQSNWWNPKLPSPSSSKPQASTSQPSTWNKMTRGTKAAWSKTTDALNPFDDKNDKPKSVTGYNTHFSQASARKKTEKKSSWWPSWGAKEEKRPKTVEDFLSQERPK